MPGFATRAIRAAGRTPDAPQRPVNVPIYQTSTFEVSSAQELADILFTATSNPEPVVFREHVREGALIYDLGRPADVDEACRSVPGVELIPGGVIRPPGRVTGRLDVHFGRGLVPACMAETIIIAIDRAYDRVSLGDRTRSENIDYFVRRGDELGFRMVEEDPVAALTA